MAKHSIDSRACFAWASAVSIILRGCVSLPPVSSAAPKTAAPFKETSATATLRWLDENSSAKIFILDSALKFSGLFHRHLAVMDSKVGAVFHQFRPSVDPFHDGDSRALKKILVQTCPTDLSLALQPIEIEMKQRQAHTAVFIYQCKSGRLDARFDPEAASQSFHKVRLSRTQISLQSDDPAWRNLDGPTLSQFFSLAGAFCHHNLDHELPPGLSKWV